MCLLVVSAGESERWTVKVGGFSCRSDGRRKKEKSLPESRGLTGAANEEHQEEVLLELTMTFHKVPELLTGC